MLPHAPTQSKPSTCCAHAWTHRELLSTTSGGLEFRQSCEFGHGRGIGSWRRRQGGNYEGALQFYLCSMAEMPDWPCELLMLGAESAHGALVCCLFANEGRHRQVGLLQVCSRWYHLREVASLLVLPLLHSLRRVRLLAPICLRGSLGRPWAPRKKGCHLSVWGRQEQHQTLIGTLTVLV